MTEIIRHVEHDCSTGQEHWRESGPEEVAAILAHRKAFEEQAEKDAAQKDADMKLIRAKMDADPAFAALVRQTGLRMGGAS